MNKLKKSHSHCVYSIHYHLVFVVKYRRKVFTETILQDLRAIFENLCISWDCSLKEFCGEADHAYLLIEAHPALNLSILVNNFKTVSSRLIQSRHSKEIKKSLWKGALWTRAYCAISCGGAPLDVIKCYIENQNRYEK